MNRSFHSPLVVWISHEGWDANDPSRRGLQHSDAAPAFLLDALDNHHWIFLAARQMTRGNVPCCSLRGRCKDARHIVQSASPAAQLAAENASAPLRERCRGIRGAPRKGAWQQAGGQHTFREAWCRSQRHFYYALAFSS
jgi:hypothetical protein